jgi:hypothetical protein
MDERPIDSEEQPGHRETETDAPAPSRPAPQPAAALAMPPSSGKEAWRSGSGCGPRMRVYLFGLAAAILIVVLFAGLSVLRRGVWASLEQGRTAVVRSLPPDLPPGERERTTRNLDRFRSLLDRVDDPYPLMGEFMTRVRAVLEDGRLTVDEVSGLNVYIERVIEASGVPGLQLGFRISDFGFRICYLPLDIADHPAPGSRTAARFSLISFPRFVGEVGGNSKFEIRNSKYSPV